MISLYVLRTGFTVSAFLCAAMTEKSDKTTNEIIFSGKKVEDVMPGSSRVTVPGKRWLAALAPT